jgi:hypothetical protein
LLQAIHSAHPENADVVPVYTPDYKKVKWALTNFWRVVSEGEWVSVNISAGGR